VKSQRLQRSGKIRRRDLISVRTHQHLEILGFRNIPRESRGEWHGRCFEWVIDGKLTRKEAQI
jgi:hypothetical protein